MHADQKTATNAASTFLLYIAFRYSCLKFITRTLFPLSRNNSASTADYSKVPKHGVVPIPNINGNGNTPPTNGNMPFKPVPPPKPKNYRPPVQGQWENGVSVLLFLCEAQKTKYLFF